MRNKETPVDILKNIKITFEYKDGTKQNLTIPQKDLVYWGLEIGHQECNLGNVFMESILTSRRTVNIVYNETKKSTWKYTK